jgi:hypothetical protein
MKDRLLSLLAGLFVGALIAAVLYFGTRSDAQRDCYRFTREIKILQACDTSKSCAFGPEDLRRIDRLQESCQGLGK